MSILKINMRFFFNLTKTFKSARVFKLLNNALKKLERSRTRVICLVELEQGRVELVLSV